MTPAEEIKSKLDIVEVIREYIPNLKPSGVNFSALSPFNREKTPSFIVSPEKQIWHCFSSGKGGDIFTFVMEMENITFVEALRLLAPKAGVVLRQQDPKLASQRNMVLDILEAATAYYYSNLLHSPEGKAARDYLEQRGIFKEEIDKWQIGYAKDDWDDLINYLTSKGFKQEDLFTAGLTARKQGASKQYNRFRNRIMFPLNNINGNVVGFTGRAMSGSDDTAKYINSPQTIVYDKSKLLFGMDKAKMSIKQQGYAIIMEGQMDVITAHQFGFTNVIAASGTALATEQVRLLDRYTDNIIFALDADSAGQQATDKGEAIVRQFDTQIVESKD
ncbi:MAG: DNA primase, partial [bacterium]